MISSVLTVCTGNICRSPLAELLLRHRCPNLTISSAGLHAVVGNDMDPTTAEAAQKAGITTTPHRARQFSNEIAQHSDLILVMETAHRHEIAQRWPQFLGKTFLLGHFAKGTEVPDPYRLPIGHHIRAVELVNGFCEDWHKQIEKLQK